MTESRKRRQAQIKALDITMHFKSTAPSEKSRTQVQITDQKEQHSEQSVKPTSYTALLHMNGS